MRATSQYGNTPITEVALPPVNDGLYTNFSLEPQMLRVRAPNSSFLILSSDDRTDNYDERVTDVPPVDVIVGMKNGANLLMRKIKRMGAAGVYMRYQAPFVNPRNNRFRIYRLSNTKWYEFRAPNYYTSDPVDLMAFILRTFNDPAVVTWDAPIPTWTGTYDQRSQRFNLTNSLNEKFYIDYQCSAVARGFPLWAIPSIRTPTYEAADLVKLCSKDWKLGPMQCVYTRYIDFHSQALTKWSKNPNATTLAGANSLLFRVYIDNFTKYDTEVTFPGPVVWQPLIIEDKLHGFNPVWFTMNPDESITSADIYITDMFGEPLYYEEVFMTTGDPPVQENVTGSEVLRWDIIMVAEI